MVTVTRVVLDTNVLVAAAYNPASASRRIVEACPDRQLTPVLSPPSASVGAPAPDLHVTASRSMRSASSGSNRKANTSRSSRMWPPSVVPVRGTMPASRANRKTT